jgi:ATP-dependent Lon protease
LEVEFLIKGLKEKLLAAKREGLYEVLLPLMNKIDFDELDFEIREGFNIHFVENFNEVV